MSNITDRRKLLISATAFGGLCFTAGAGLSGSVGSESDRSGHEYAKWYDATRFSQAVFLKLTHEELTYLHNYKIDGFMDAMASTVVKMMLSDPASTRRLMQDMVDTEGDDARKERLVAEVQRASELEQAAKASAADQTRGLRHARIYKRGVKAWLRYPREGALTVSKPIVYKLKL